MDETLCDAKIFEIWALQAADAADFEAQTQKDWDEWIEEEWEAEMARFLDTDPFHKDHAYWSE
jgi:hypothetical protein